MAKDDHRTIHTVAALVFTIAAIVHALRLINGWQFVIGGWSAPMWLSVVGVLLAGTLAVLLWKTA
jgi:hypothetical protein